MQTTKNYKGNQYTLSNENLSNGDQVFPISNGTTKDGTYKHERFDFRDFMSGWPDEPHTILNTNHDPKYKPYQTRTSHGYGPIEMYFKVISIIPIRKEPKPKKPSK